MCEAAEQGAGGHAAGAQVASTPQRAHRHWQNLGYIRFPFLAAPGHLDKACLLKGAAVLCSSYRRPSVDPERRRENDALEEQRAAASGCREERASAENKLHQVKASPEAHAPSNLHAVHCV